MVAWVLQSCKAKPKRANTDMVAVRRRLRCACASSGCDTRTGCPCKGLLPLVGGPSYIGVEEAGASITERVPWKGLLMCVGRLPCMGAVEEGSTVCVSSGGGGSGSGSQTIAFLAVRRPAAWVPS